MFSVKKTRKLFLPFLFFICLKAGVNLENDVMRIDSPSLCEILVSMFFTVPHKMATGSQTDDFTKMSKGLLATIKEKFVNDMKDLLHRSKQLRSDFKKYFDPSNEKNGIKWETNKLYTLLGSLDPEVNLYTQRLRRLTIAELLSFLKEHVYQNNNFPYHYQRLYNEMLLSLHHKTVYKVFKNAYAFSFPKVEFNQEVIFKELESVWAEYEKLPSEGIEKIVHLYKTYQLLCLVVGDTLGEAESERYRTIRRKCVTALEGIEDDPSHHKAPGWFSVENGKKRLSPQALSCIESNLFDPKVSLFKGQYQKGSKRKEFLQEILFNLGPLFKEKKYIGFIRLWKYLLRNGDEEEKKVLNAEFVGYQDWMEEERNAPYAKRISKELPPLPSLAEVKKEFEEELRSCGVLARLKSYPCGNILDYKASGGYNQATCNLMNVVKQKGITPETVERMKFLPTNYQEDPLVNHNQPNQGSRSITSLMLPLVAGLGIITFIYTLLKKYRKATPNEEDNESDTKPISLKITV